MYRLATRQLSKRFGDRRVFEDISLEIVTGQSLGIVGENGSGKSTLLSILLGYQRPTRGHVQWENDGQPLTDARRRDRMALVAPYLNLYDQLTAEENLVFLATVGDIHITGKEINALLARVGLEGRGQDMVGAYSSGMKQRIKYAAALLGRPDFLLLDEPTANLDEKGKTLVADLIEEYRREAIVIVATNEEEEYRFADQLCRLGN
ncbi:ATP-binding cassette domain-containing protein [candidate division GN15 bacterium]|nr:ATP-binding cassette domain-containing protein [candidate division GN15 bacterium]